MRPILLALLLIALPANAESYTAKDSRGNSVTITDKPCGLPWFTGWQKAVMRFEGKNYEACWRTKGASIVVFDSDGDISSIPVSMFEKDAET